MTDKQVIKKIKLALFLSYIYVSHDLNILNKYDNYAIVAFVYLKLFKYYFHNF